jgi:hypothetical protein
MKPGTTKNERKWLLNQGEYFDWRQKSKGY